MEFKKGDIVTIKEDEKSNYFGWFIEECNKGEVSVVGDKNDTVYISISCSKGVTIVRKDKLVHFKKEVIDIEDD